MTEAAAHVTNERLDILASNQLKLALYSELFDGRVPPVNAPRFVFLDPRAREFYFDWDRAARDVVAVLRSAADRNPQDRELSDLIGESSTRSDEFRTYWASHNVRVPMPRADGLASTGQLNAWRWDRACGRQRRP